MSCHRYRAVVAIAPNHTTCLDVTATTPELAAAALLEVMHTPPPAGAVIDVMDLDTFRLVLSYPYQPVP